MSKDVMGNLFQLFNRLVLLRLTSEYKNSFLGLVWLIFQPIITLFVYLFVFTYVFKTGWSVDKQQSASFALNLFVGLSVFKFFSESVLSSSVSIYAKPNYVKKIVFPLELLPLVEVGATFLTSLIWIAIVVILGMIEGAFSPSAFIGAIWLIPLWVTTVALALVAAALTVYVRDFQYILEAVLQILFFATPILYPLSRVPEPYCAMLKLNPLSGIISSMRSAFFSDLPFNFSLFFSLTLASCFFFFLAWFIFKRVKVGFADVI